MKYLTPIFGCLICLLTVSPLAANVNFTDPRFLSFPTPQTAIATGDLNGDTIPDLIVGGEASSEEPAKVRIFLGTGNGNFRYLTEYPVSTARVVEIKVGDLNGDGILDVVAAHDRSNPFIRVIVTIFLGNGDGTLAKGVPTFVNNQDETVIVSLELTDYNADGMLDIIVAGRLSGAGYGKIFGLFNVGGGNFQPRFPSLIGEEILAMDVSDLDFNGYPDLVLATFHGAVILYGEGDTHYQHSQEFERNVQLGGVAVGDFNSDGKPDIAATELSNPTLRLYLSRFGRLQEAAIVMPMAAAALYLETGDVNRDGKTDLIAFSSTRQLQILYGDGRGGFSAPQSLSMNLPVTGVALSDLDLDGKPDLACSLGNRENSERAAIFLNEPNPRRYYADFDADVAADPTVFRPSTSVWWTLNSRDLSYRATPFGLATDKLVPGNYDNDNKTDIAVFRDGQWIILQSSDLSVRYEHWGLPDDVPVPADYDNDGIMNLAVFRSSDATWYIKTAGGFTATHWGLSTDIPIEGDYDGDGLADIGVFRPSNGGWHVRPSSGAAIISIQFGSDGDLPLRGDFDGDGRSDFAVFRPSDVYWYIRESSSGNVRYVPFGSATDIPVPADYDGDNKTDVAVFRPGTGVWYVLRSSNGSTSSFQWGTSSDRVP